VPRQRGVSLIFSLMTLVALSLAAVALIRSVDTGATILGNLSFKQDSLLAADEASSQAITWLKGNSGTALYEDNAAQGYHASLSQRLDAANTRPGDATRTVVDWNLDDCAGDPANSYAACIKPVATEIALSNGQRARWVIERMCGTAGDPTLNTVQCAKPMSSSLSTGTDPSGGGGYSSPGLAQAVLEQYYRIVVRTRGTRNSTSTTETLVHLR
jgi:Tfp pilus assembly protein PilX